ncbi:MAG: S41 family peptidase [Pseudomonadota bacterium]
MYRTISAIGLGFLVLLGQPAETAANEWLLPADIEADVGLLERSLQHLHPGYQRFTDSTALADGWADIVATANAANGMSQADLYLAVSRHLTTIRCNHTKAELPANLVAERRITPTYLPFRWQLIGPDRRAVVVASSVEVSIRSGDELVAIDGKPIDALIETFVGFIPADGYADAARYPEVAFSSEFPGGAIEHFGALTSAFADTVEVEFIGADGTAFSRTVKRLSGDQWRTMLQDTGGFYRNFKDAVELEFVAPEIARLSVATFVNYRQPVQPAVVYDPIFRAIAEQDIDVLVLDLRGNGGGSDNAQLGLLERLLLSPTRLMRDVVAAANNLGPATGHVESWDQRALAMAPDDYEPLENGLFRVNPDWVGRNVEWLPPHPLAFQGELIVLVDSSLSSGSNHLVSRLQDRPGLTLVGSDGGGNAAGATAGILFTLRLPASGIGVRIPAWRQTIDRDGLSDGQPVRPDLRVEPTLATWRRGEDPVLEAALVQAHKRRRASR